MEPKRYWWYNYQSGYNYHDKVTDVHPFIEVAMSPDRHIINWKLISVEEFNIWKSIHEKNDTSL